MQYPLFPSLHFIPQALACLQIPMKVISEKWTHQMLPDLNKLDIWKSYSQIMV